MVKYLLRSFTPQEAAAITGVSQESQRDWRRRGLLKKTPSGGRNAYDHMDLAKFMTMKTLSETGIDLSKAQKIADAAALTIVFGLGRRLLKKADEGPPSIMFVPDHLLEKPEKTGKLRPMSEIDAYLRQSESKVKIDLSNLDAQQFFLLYYIHSYYENSGEHPQQRPFFYVVWNGSIGAPEFVLDIDKWFRENDSSGAVIILDTRPILNELASELSQLTDPLLTVIEPDTKKGAA
jgi:DNA-binding transcriptional MerR regulator